MSGIVYGDFTDATARTLYKTMWENNDFLKNIAVEKVPVTRKEKNGTKVKGVSDNSYCFAGDSNKEEILKNVFRIRDAKLFHQKLMMACGGYGREYRRITTLHSSSLCALLFFYHVSVESGYQLELEINNKKYIFIQSLFEFKSPVFSNPSNMDVVLVGNEVDSGEKTILFLESKFSEYYTSAARVQYKISSEYRKKPDDPQKQNYSLPFYEEDFWKKLNTSENPAAPQKGGKDAEYFNLESTEKYYIGGIKQLISHYTGIRNLLQSNFYDGEKSAEQVVVEQDIQKGAKIILAEILFTDRIGQLSIDHGASALSSYSGKYAEFVSKANQLIQEDDLQDRFIVADTELSYDIFKGSKAIEPEILEFYFG